MSLVALEVRYGIWSLAFFKVSTTGDDGVELVKVTGFVKLIVSQFEMDSSRDSLSTSVAIEKSLRFLVERVMDILLHNKFGYPGDVTLVTGIAGASCEDGATVLGVGNSIILVLDVRTLIASLVVARL